MALSKTGINSIFALIAAVLALSAVAALYLNRDSSAGIPAANRETPEAQLPENHPSGEIAEMLISLEQKMAKEPENPAYPAQIANLYYDAGQFDKAVGYYERSLDIHPEDPAVETDLATCLHYLDQSDRALQLLDKVLKYQPHFPQAMFNKGIVLMSAKNDIQGTIEVWEHLLQADPVFAREAELEQKINQLKASAR
jgi:cytochrome c-type biogenesis protein CcmH/NrfG